MGTYSLHVTDAISSTVGPWNSFGACTGLTVASFNTPAPSSAGPQRLCDGTTNTNANQAIRLSFSIVNPAISLDGGADISFAGLPSGFTPTSAVLTINATRGAQYSGLANMFFQFSPGIESAPIAGMAFTPPALDLTFTRPTAPSAFDLFAQGYGIRFSSLGVNDTFLLTNARITGSYSIVATQWYYSPSLDVFNSTGGGDFTPVSPPTVTVTGVFPNQGTTAGGIATAIEGSGFSQAATATIVGVNVTGVTVVNQHRMLCTTGAYGGALGSAVPFTIGGEDPDHVGAVVSAKLAVGDVVVTDN